MTTVKVQAGQSILEGYVKRPSVGLSEPIWNAFDGDAHLVTITCGYNGLHGLEEITVADDGNGMNLQRAELAFSRVGDCWTLMPGTRSDSGDRVVHGRHGRGRYAAFSFGNVVRWVSTAEQVEGGSSDWTAGIGSFALRSPAVLPRSRRMCSAIAGVSPPVHASPRRM